MGTGCIKTPTALLKYPSLSEGRSWGVDRRRAALQTASEMPRPVAQRRDVRHGIADQEAGQKARND